ncbi:MAG: hypothetical protein JO019_00535 [Candidatus Kaiserbacteria bacterium]|nr:hypothetical protein [Candidatus Kaiserbacteria bacterium]
MSAKKLLSATAIAFLLTAGAAAAQTTGSTTDTTGTASTTVGTPNTGAGGDAMINTIVLATSAAIALGGAAILARRRTV